jgi:thiamine transport system ATP-binding protein
MGLRLQGVRKVYPDFRLELDFEARPGELLTLLGPSGCGKTTTLRLIAGFIRQDDGHLYMGGRLIDELPPHRRGIGIVFQDYALFTHLNVRENVAFGLRMQGLGRREASARVAELLRLMSLQGYEERKVTGLSGGEQQRVALARALAPGPRLLLLDEPLSALDAKLREALRKEILRIQRELGVTTVYVTHDQEEALAIADRIAVMHAGRVEQLDAPEVVYSRPRNLFVATFVGQINLLRGRVVQRRNGYALLETRFGPFRAACPRGEAGGPSPGEAGGPTSVEAGGSTSVEAIVMFRPESCRVNGGSGNRLHGTVRRREYLGSHLLLDVEAGGQSFLLDLAAPAPYARGQRIEFTVEPEACCLVPP